MVRALKATPAWDASRINLPILNRQSPLRIANDALGVLDDLQQVSDCGRADDRAASAHGQAGAAERFGAKMS